MSEKVREIEFQIGINIQRCKEHGYYFANSPEYPCPWCNISTLESQLAEKEDKIRELEEKLSILTYDCP